MEMTNEQKAQAWFEEYTAEKGYSPSEIGALDMIAFSAFCLDKREKETAKSVPYQACPICNGSGAVWNPHAGSTNPTLICSVCHGAKIIPQYAIQP